MVYEDHARLGLEVTGTSCVDKVRRGVARIRTEVEIGHRGQEKGMDPTLWQTSAFLPVYPDWSMALRSF